MKKYQFYDGYKYFVTYSLSKDANFTFDNKTKEIIYQKLLTKKGNISIDAFAILDNHVHLLLDLREVEQKISKRFINELSGASSREINKYLGRTGNNWQHYYGWGIFTEKAYYNILSYILGNPIRHGIVKSFDELHNHKYCNFKKFADDIGKRAAEDFVLKILKIKSQQNEKTFLKNLMKDDRITSP